MPKNVRPKSSAEQALAEARPQSFWLDRPDAPSVNSSLVGDDSADLAVVGGGFTGLWTALIAKERTPDRDVVVLERESCPSGASGQNGGFLMGSFVDAFNLPNFKGQEKQLIDLGRDNRGQIESALDRHEIDCDFEPNGWVMNATKPWHLDELAEIQKASQSGGMKSILWNADEVQASLKSPMFLGGLFEPDVAAIVHPGKLTWGLKRACERLGVRIYEFTPVSDLAQGGGGLRLTTPYGNASATNVILATYAHPSLHKRLRYWRIPIYSHVLATKPLTSEQLESIGWDGRQGFIDLDAFYYYYRLTADNSIIWGFVGGILHPGRGVRPDFEQDPSVFSTMARDFFDRFPQLEGIEFSHRWGGAVDNSSRGAPLFGTFAGGRAAFANGYSAGVGGSRAGATVMLDLLAGERTPYTELPLVSGRGLHGSPSLRPYPPEPFLSIGMRLARWSVEKEAETGRRHWFARLLNRLGYVF